jgi:hypothetical protein
MWNQDSPDSVVSLHWVNTSANPVIKFLGVFFDPTFSFKNHISTISSKISKSLFVLRSAKNILSQKALKSLYYYLIHSNLIYCIQIWSCASQSSVNSLFAKQKAAIRLINLKTYNAHTESLFEIFYRVVKGRTNDILIYNSYIILPSTISLLPSLICGSQMTVVTSLKTIYIVSFVMQMIFMSFFEINLVRLSPVI